MLPKNCGQLLFNAVRETLETMAFAEVVPCSIKVGGEEFSQVDDDFSVGGTPVAIGGESLRNGNGVNPNNSTNTPDNWGVASAEVAAQPSDSWGNASSDSWGSPDNGNTPPTQSSAFGQSSSSSFASSNNTNPGNAGIAGIAGTSALANNPVSGVVAAPVSGWEDIDAEQNKQSNSEWAPINIVAPSRDPWGDSDAVAAAPAATMALKEADFDEMVKQFTPEEWCWACMKVNSPDIHSVWFIVTKGLANVLAHNMYAGEEFQLDNQLIRDLIAELTNVLGGKLMLLLEEMGGKFTLTVPEIGFGLPELPDEGYENAVCKVVVDGEHPVIVALCFNPGGINATGNS
ncbi:MAG: hypothetical protein LBL39_04205 [Planctomycetaceae bacterium]|jgi:hypothetical protein|nr:hypothetical protein [Planctomycetaceae bacterium]